MSILVTTPTGNIGSRIVERLVDAGGDVRVFLRDPSRLAPEVAGRVHAHVGTLEDADALARALDGVRTLFFLIPPAATVADWRRWQREVGRAGATAATRAGVERVVFLSSLGAHRDDLGPVSGVGEVEGLLRDAFAHVVALRPGYFFENAFAAVPTIAGDGTIYGGFPPDLAFPQVATQDIGDVAARWLLDDAWRGHHVVGIHGPRDLSMDDVARDAAAALGRPVRYVHLPVEAVQQGMAGAGLGPSVVAGYGEMIRGYTASRFEHPEARTPETTTPTEFGAWAAAALRPAVEGFARSLPSAAAGAPAHA